MQNLDAPTPSQTNFAAWGCAACASMLCALVFALAPPGAAPANGSTAGASLDAVLDRAGAELLARDIMEARERMAALLPLIEIEEASRGAALSDPELAAARARQQAEIQAMETRHREARERHEQLLRSFAEAARGAPPLSGSIPQAAPESNRARRARPKLVV